MEHESFPRCLPFQLRALLLLCFCLSSHTHTHTHTPKRQATNNILFLLKSVTVLFSLLSFIFFPFCFVQFFFYFYFLHRRHRFLLAFAQWMSFFLLEGERGVNGRFQKSTESKMFVLGKEKKKRKSQRSFFFFFL